MSTHIMEMPFGLIVADEKLTDYLLVYQEQNDKSKYLALAGYTNQNWQQLKQDILRAVEGTEAEVTSTVWADKFTVRTQLHGINGTTLKTITIWQRDNGSNTIRFVTLFRDKSKED